MRSRISIRGYVCPSVGRSDGQSVGHTRVETMQKWRFWSKLLSVRARTHLRPCIRPCSIQYVGKYNKDTVHLMFSLWEFHSILAIHTSFSFSFSSSSSFFCLLHITPFPLPSLLLLLMILLFLLNLPFLSRRRHFWINKRMGAEFNSLLSIFFLSHNLSITVTERGLIHI